MVRKDPVKNGTLLHIYSDRGLYIRQVGTDIGYKEVYEPVGEPCRKYVEVQPKEAG